MTVSVSQSRTTGSIQRTERLFVSVSPVDVVAVRHITAALRSQQEVELNRQEVTRTLNRMFHSVSQEVPGHVSVEAPEETCSLMFRLSHRCDSGLISAASLHTALIALSAESLLGKYRALVSVAEGGSGSVSRSGLRSLLQDLSQVPTAVQEEGVFGGVEAAVKSCFDGVLTPTARGEHVLSWLQSEPRLLLWLPTLYRLSVSQSVTHSVRCHACKTLPITGLRYRCMKCVNVHLCQSCFLTNRQTHRHKTCHPVIEFCTQPTWRESLSSLVHSACHALLPRRSTQREADRRRGLMWAEPEETQDSTQPPSDAPTRLAASAVSHGQVRPPTCSLSSKALQTDEDTPTQQLKASVLLKEVKDLHRDRWLMEEQLQAWRLTVQSEHGILEDRCSQMEVTMETLRDHNLRLQRALTHALNKMEAQEHDKNPPQSLDQENMEKVENEENAERENSTVVSDSEGETEEEEEELLKTEDDWSKEELQTPSPTMHQHTRLSHDIHYEEEGEESATGWSLCRPIALQDGPEEAEPQDDDTCLSEEEQDEDCGTCSPEELLQETVERLKTVMERDRWTERETGERRRAELVVVAEQVGDCIERLVDAVRAGTH
ncbi:dystrotelin [Plectropomus leopardus]|uniref:dystrotelin n=1 Tax=Plectropomus leopardus TaxID=160734 RepID=UPI001C4CD7B0|nr:dystrotelin [Plectropomus leopardus]